MHGIEQQYLNNEARCVSFFIGAPSTCHVGHMVELAEHIYGGTDDG
jgi:hypothetical protein